MAGITSSTGFTSRLIEGGAVMQATGVALREPLPWGQMRQLVETAEQTGHEFVFVPEIAAREAFTTLTGFALTTRTIRVGTGVVTVRSRSPAITAMAAATLHELSGGRLVLGIGSGRPTRRSRRADDEDPVGLVRDYVRVLRQALSGRPVDVESRWDVERFTLGLPAEGLPPPVWLGALGDRMVALAGAEADGVILNWCTPDRVSRARDTLRGAAAASGRDPSALTVAVYVRACLGVEDGVAMRALQAAAAQYASIPHYLRQMDRMGLGPQGRRAARAAERGRPGEVPEDLVRSLTVAGGRDEWLARARAFHGAGADIVVVYPVPALEPFSSLLGTIMTAAPSLAVEQ
jgi:alkanesulfonate monooxygenase SsuD/methylene tetrahydromethanopterin reductase-like flavin-dependent oxidoreductase (luciferase family)